MIAVGVVVSTFGYDCREIQKYIEIIIAIIISIK